MQSSGHLLDEGLVLYLLVQLPRLRLGLQSQQLVVRDVYFVELRDVSSLVRVSLLREQTRSTTSTE